MKVPDVIAWFALTATMVAATTPPTAVRDGVYKQLNYVEEAGDLLGMELEVRLRPKPSVIVTTCEGGCFGGKVWPLRVHHGSIAFAVCDPFRSEKGRETPCNPVRYVGQFRPDGALAVSVLGQGDAPLILRRVIHPKPRQVQLLACGRVHC